MYAIILFFIIMMVPVVISVMFIPYWTRKTESFGVSIPEKVYHEPNLKAMRKQYALLMGILGFVIMVVFLLFTPMVKNDENTMSILLSVVVSVFIAGSFIAYLTFHHKMKRLKASENWGLEKSQLIVIDTAFRDQKLNYSNWWFIFSFIISLATAIITFRLYEQIPEKIPMQYNFSGEITNWADKSYRTVLIMPVMQVYLTLIFLFINTMIAKAKQQVSAEDPENSMRRNVIFRRRWSTFIIVSGIALSLMFTFIQLSFIYPINQLLLISVPLALSIGVTIWAIVLSITTGQGGSRIKSTQKSGNAVDRDDDRYWKLGMFYFNKNDPAFFLEKRFGVGWTINYANPVALISLLVIILLSVAIPFLLGA